MAFYLRTLCVLSVLSLTSCKQGVGERCEIQSDCEPGLFCEASEGMGSVKVCKTDENVAPDGGGQIMVDAATLDAANPPDADTTDAPL